MLTTRSRQKLQGVQPDLVRVVERADALCPPELAFVVIEGLRTPERQVQLIAAGASQTMRSRHLTGHAVDLAAVVGSEVRWDWPLYDRIAGIMQRAAELERVDLEWGGHWTTLRDGPHFQLTWKAYPLPVAQPQQTIA